MLKAEKKRTLLLMDLYSKIRYSQGIALTHSYTIDSMTKNEHFISEDEKEWFDEFMNKK